MTNELKPCPFCGGEPTVHEVDWCEPSEWHIACGTRVITEGEENNDGK